MISSKRLIKLARKWQKMAATKRQRISFTRNGDGQNSSSSAANKGHFVVYTTDKARFAIPLKYLGKNVFRELLRMSEEEFGIPNNGPIILPCHSNFLNHVLSLVRGGKSEDLEKSLLTSLETCHFSVCLHLAKHPAINSHLFVAIEEILTIYRFPYLVVYKLQYMISQFRNPGKCLHQMVLGNGILFQAC